MKRTTNLDLAEIVFVKWNDSFCSYGWNPPDQHGPSIIQSVGILVHHAKEFIVISTSRASAGNYCDQLTIPKKAIISIHGEDFRKP